MTARRDGDEYVVNGQKTWTSNGRLADWMFILVRTDPGAAKAQAGISFLLVDLRTPGITRQAHPLLDRLPHVCRGVLRRRASAGGQPRRP